MSHSSEAVPAQSGKEQAGRGKGVSPVTFPFIQALQEWLQLLLIEDCTLCVPLPQDYPSLLQPGNLKVDGADGECWRWHSHQVPNSGITGHSERCTVWPWNHGP